MIRCEAKTLRGLFRLGVFTPAAVQREYQWTTKEAGQLLNDLFEAFTKAGLDPDDAPEAASSGVPDADESEADGDSEASELPDAPVIQPLTAAVRAARDAPQAYFLGSMVLYPAPKAKDSFAVYDGLQRFTTLSLLVSVLRDSFSGQDADYWLQLKELLRTGDVPPQPRLAAPTPGGSLATITGSIGGSLTKWKGRSSDADSRMRDVVALFHGKIGAWSDDRRIAFAKFLKDNTWVAVTLIENRTMAYRVFVTANDRGLSLGVGDILKGRIVEMVAEKLGLGAAENISVEWKKLQKTLRSHFSDFLRALDFLECGIHRPTDFGEALIDRLETATAEEVVEWVTVELARQRARFLTLFGHEGQESFAGPTLALRRLYFLADRGWHPVALALMWATEKKGASEWIKQLNKLVAACYTLELLDWAPHYRAEKYAAAIRQIKAGRDPFRHKVAGGDYGAFYFTDDLRERARTALSSTFPEERRRSALVRWLETLYWDETAVPALAVRDTNVEHVLPRAAKGQWMEDFPEATRGDDTHRLGNLCLIRPELNEELANAEYDVKRAAFLAEPDIYRSAHEVASMEAWTPETVLQRTTLLAARAAKALNLEPRRNAKGG